MGVNFETGLDELEELIDPDGEEDASNNVDGEDARKLPKRKA